MSVGIHGYGSFGALLVEQLAPYLDIKLATTKDPSELNLPDHVQVESFKAAAECDIVIPAIPLGSYKDWLRNVYPYLAPGSLVVDICSVKVKPIEMLLKGLPRHVQIMATHPIFGPQSASSGLDGQPIVVHPVRFNDPSFYNDIKQFLSEKLKLNVIEMDPDTHDRKMAIIHSLTFFIGRGLLNMNIERSDIDTGTFKNVLGLSEIVHLTELESHHTKELFETIESGNPYAAETRKEFIKKLRQLDRESRDVEF